jgi:hypothetical protein
MSMRFYRRARMRLVAALNTMAANRVPSHQGYFRASVYG